MTREDAIGVIKGSMPTFWKETKEAIQTLIPELAESEDEKVRNWLIDFIKAYGWSKQFSVTKDETLEWLEKQKEQKSQEWILPEDFEDAVYKVANFISPFDSQDELRRMSHHFAEQLMSLAKKELVEKPAEWSEEDELMRNACVAFIQDEKFKGYERSYECIDWLKSLRPQSHWKPSKEQMEALNTLLCIGGLSYHGQHSQLQGLYNELKEL